MKGSASAAVTVVNAFATGKGVAIGIDMWTSARVKVTSGGIEGKILVRGKEVKDYRLVRAVVGLLRELTGGDFGIRFEITSEIPVGKGLKSSSAAANALTEALVKALKLDLEPLQVVRLGVEAAKRAGVTLTGAFDDACASYFGGLCITDNTKNELLGRREVEGETVVLMPGESLMTESLRGLDFSVLRPYVEEAFRLALAGEWRKAAVINGLIYGTFLGHDTKPFRVAMSMGAVPGLSGKGPAVFAITDEPERLAEAWEPFGEVEIRKLR
ncbi:aroK shikimate kinase [Thermococcus onnurineus NA1]|uniref:Shikimate kinase n=1 Tax=Thermococcus onnurineus (strain NA1) TaxID=523850 RepID=B6YX12_THEON|nr:aroK shikimate kinase [Thermococcus onnurineus NA1]